MPSEYRRPYIRRPVNSSTMIDFAVLDDVLLIVVEEIPRFERGVELMRQLDDCAGRRGCVMPSIFSTLATPGFGDRHRVRFLVDRIVFVLFQARHESGRISRRARSTSWRRAADDQRRARFVDEDRVDFVDDREVELALHQIFDLPRHVVAQVVEADLVVRDVGDVAVVRGAALTPASRSCWITPTVKPEELDRSAPSTRRRAARDSR